MNGYRKLTRKTITLPSGAVCTIRKMKAADYLAAGQPPASVLEAQRTGKPPDGEKLTPEDIAWMGRLGTRILTHCVGPLTLDGEIMRIVDKPWTECADGEVAISELEQADADAIAAAVREFSGSTGKEAVEQDPTFPEQHENGSGGASVGADVRETAIGNPESGPG